MTERGKGITNQEYQRWLEARPETKGGKLIAEGVGRKPILSAEQASAMLEAAGVPIADGMRRDVLVQLLANEAVLALHRAFALAEREMPRKGRGRPRYRLHDYIVPRVAAYFELAFGKRAYLGSSDGDGGPFVRMLGAFFRGIVESVPRTLLPDDVARLWLAPQSTVAVREASRDPKPRGAATKGDASRRRRLGTAEEEREAVATERARWPEWLERKAVFGILEDMRSEYAVATRQPAPLVVVTAQPPP